MLKPSRRQFALLAAGAALAPSVAMAEPPPPAIIAAGGASEDRIADTRSALVLAIDQGADFLQVNLAPSKDGVLMARRDNELSAGTDIASHPEFAGRRTTKTIDGAEVAGWFTEDFTVPELKSLMCREAHPELHPHAVKYDGQEPMLTLDEVLQIARDGCVRTARTIGVCPRLIHAAYFEGLDLHVVEGLAQDLAAEGYTAAAAAIWVQAREPDVLRAFGRLSRVRRMLLVDGPNAEGAASIDTSPQGLADVRAYAEAIAPQQDLLLAPDAATFPAPTTLALDAHAAGLKVFSRTARAENRFLPAALRWGDSHSPSYLDGRGDVDKMLLALFADRVDGVATDVPANAAHARKAVIDAIRDRASGG